MHSNPYSYFRGTAPQYQRDLSENVPEFATDHSNSRVSKILVIGDPHPENIGSFRGVDGDLIVDFNDFDAARYGPFHFDVRRLAVGFLVASWFIGEDLVDAQAGRAWARAAIDGYVSEIRSLSEGSTPLKIVRNAGFGAIVDDLLRRAQRDGFIYEELLEYTEVRDDGTRRPRFGTVEESDVDGVFRDEFRPVDDDEINMLRRALKRYIETASTTASRARFKGAGRRLGAGVASYPVMRWYVLTEGPTESVDDDELLEVKEILDPPALPGLSTFRRSWTSNGERVVLSQRRLQLTSQNDPLLGWMNSGTLSFRVRHRTKYQKGIDVNRMRENIQEGEWQPADIEEFAHLAGRLLANSHARGGTASNAGADNAAAIDAAVGNDDEFADETHDFALAYFRTVRTDYRLFQELFEQKGPLLGYEAPR